MLTLLVASAVGLLVATPATLSGARAGSPACVEQAMAPIQLADEKFTGNVAQYLVDLHDSKAAFDFCGGMLFQLKLSDMLYASLAEAAKTGADQPVVFDASKNRMNKLPDYSKTGAADNIRLFHGREVRQVPDAAGGMGFVLQLSHSGEDPEGWSKEERATYDGWGHDQGRQWRTADMYQAEGFTSFKKTFGDKAYGLNHRCYWHLDGASRLWLSAEDGCEGVYPPTPKRKMPWSPF